ncbi:MAG: ABC-ATPase domain-containing protein [Methanomassiliicoccales archaeon]|nr:MAG: ABC-ATPase domain-containing protein [Methanomassiliicoccales archaeon]
MRYLAGAEDLKRILSRIDGRGYKAYKDLQGDFEFDFFKIYIDHVQGDPFASPSKIRVRVSQDHAKLPDFLFENRIRQLALEDFLARKVKDAILRTNQKRRGSGKSGLIAVDSGGQEVLKRTAVVLTRKWVEARLHMGLPARGRRVLGEQAKEMFCRDIPQIIKGSLIWENLSEKEAQRFVECIENQEHIRKQLEALGLVAFVGDNSILPRESGAVDHPLSREHAVPFLSAEALRIEIELLNPIPGLSENVDSISGMGIPKGITLIVGGGYHGKSTLLRALERGVYPHIPKDGREYVVTSYDAVKIRAEDGRRVEQVDISPFIDTLPQGRSTTTFSTDDASGSTSQAANIMEALEVGAKVLLLDEDTSATNFMVRDARMQSLVAKENEPITPFLDRVRELYETLGVSTILVMGGCGDYFDVADCVIMMREFLPIEVTEEAKKITHTHTTSRKVEAKLPFSQRTKRIPLAQSFDPSRGKRQVKIDAKAKDLLLFGREPIDLRHVEQLVDLSQSRAVGYAVHLATKRFINGKVTLYQVMEAIEDFFDENGLDALDPFHRKERHPGNFARPRKYEIAAAINRLRTVRMQQKIEK